MKFPIGSGIDFGDDAEPSGAGARADRPDGQPGGSTAARRAADVRRSLGKSFLFGMLRSIGGYVEPHIGIGGRRRGEILQVGPGCTVTRPAGHVPSPRRAECCIA
jgi:hypothetical protein